MRLKRRKLGYNGQYRVFRYTRMVALRRPGVEVRTFMLIDSLIIFAKIMKKSVFLFFSTTYVSFAFLSPDSNICSEK